MTLLAIRDLTVSVRGPAGKTTILDRVGLSVEPGGAVALVGESGSGKSLTAFAAMGLLPAGARVESGSVLFEDKNLLELRERELCAVRGARLAMVFQEPSAALNPVYTIGSQISEAVRLHQSISRRDARALAERWLADVGMPAPSRAYDSYPHELSGGMRQRAMLAIALIAGPSLLIADEPTASLDRTLEAQVLELIAEQRRKRKMALLLVSHDLATVSEVTVRVVVLYAGEVVEEGPTASMLDAPAHPYTQALVASIPDPSKHGQRRLGQRAPLLPVLPGAPPRFDMLPPGCRFAPRCDQAFDRCAAERPPLYATSAGGSVRCFLYDTKAEAAS